MIKVLQVYDIDRDVNIKNAEILHKYKTGINPSGFLPYGRVHGNVVETIIVSQILSELVHDTEENISLLNEIRSINNQIDKLNNLRRELRLNLKRVKYDEIGKLPEYKHEH